MPQRNLTVALAAAAAAAAVLAGLGLTAAPAGAATRAEAPVPQPGPAILYAPPPRAPQLENAPGSPWQADPIMISGAGAYRDGEYLYQDYLFDDQGAGATFTYPSDPRYEKNAADLVELRMKVVPEGLAFRLTLNSMKDAAAASLVADTIALGGTPGTTYAMPFNAGAKEPAQVFVTVHGTSVEVTDAASGQPLDASGARATVDAERRQVTVVIPRHVYDVTGLSTLRVASATGLWDTRNNQYLQPASAATATQPGGTKPLVNVAFRFNETSGEWRDTNQGTALTSGDLSSYSVNLDLAKLRAGATDDMAGRPGGVPTHGYEDRIYASHFEDIQGRGAQPGTSYCHEPCWPATHTPDFGSQLQPYALTVPDKPAPPTGYGMTLNLHYCGGNYNDGPPDASALANRGTGSLVLTPEDRGGCYWYWSEAGADTFEAWADAGRHFHLDPTYNSISGWSMGGYGTYKLAAEFPDLFATAVPDIGCVSAETDWAGEPSSSTSGQDAEIVNLVASYRNIPFLSANASADQYCLNSSQAGVLRQFLADGYRMDWRQYTGDHGPYYPTSDETAAFMGTAHVDPNPPHVTWVYDGGMQEPKWGMTADHAYWLSGVQVASASANNDLGKVDVFSHGFGLADPVAGSPTPEAGAGTLAATPNGGAYAGESVLWAAPAAQPAADQLDVTLTNVGAVTIDPARAKVDCNATINATSDSAAKVTLLGCDRTVSVPATPPSSTPGVRP